MHEFERTIEQRTYDLGQEVSALRESLAELRRQVIALRDELRAVHGRWWTIVIAVLLEPFAVQAAAKLLHW